MKQLLTVHPQRGITHGQLLRAVILSPGLLFLPRDIIYIYCDPPRCFPLFVPSCICLGLSVTETLSEYTKHQRNCRGIEASSRIALLKIMVKSWKFLYCMETRGFLKQTGIYKLQIYRTAISAWYWGQFQGGFLAVNSKLEGALLLARTHIPEHLAHGNKAAKWGQRCY